MMKIERHRCIIRWILALTASNGKKAGAEFIDRVEKRHGSDYAEKLRADCRSQWKAGNRGVWGDWR
jgi:hypothetical protein